MIMAVFIGFRLTGATAIACAIIPAGCGNREEKAASLPPVASTVQQPASGDTRKIVAAFGDSISAGFGVGQGKSFPDDLQRLIDRGRLPFRVINEGVSGDTTTDGVERLSTVLALHPAIVVLEFGGNDGLRGLPVESTRNNLATMIEGLQAAGIKVILAGMTLPPNYGPDYIRPFERMYTDLARRYKITLIPFILQGVGGNPRLTQPDGIHPTAEGAEVVANTVMQYLQPLLH
jgi:acyl-CoA thioesterase-1